MSSRIAAASKIANKSPACLDGANFVTPEFHCRPCQVDCAQIESLGIRGEKPKWLATPRTDRTWHLSESRDGVLGAFEGETSQAVPKIPPVYKGTPTSAAMTPIPEHPGVCDRSCTSAGKDLWATVQCYKTYMGAALTKLACCKTSPVIRGFRKRPPVETDAKDACNVSQGQKEPFMSRISHCLACLIEYGVTPYLAGVKSSSAVLTKQRLEECCQASGSLLYVTDVSFVSTRGETES
ncbi:hypothetical protein F5Y06DRAFT_297045 [Hypoxylon sp. FL0890]|nr:hypothetical protein F5Y06DRAFT_297045 [Hypoxylon sp. FL0890]